MAGRRGPWQVSWLAGQQLRSTFPGPTPKWHSTTAALPLTVAGTAADQSPLLGKALLRSLLIPRTISVNGYQERIRIIRNSRQTQVVSRILPTFGGWWSFALMAAVTVAMTEFFFAVFKFPPN